MIKNIIFSTAKNCICTLET